MVGAEFLTATGGAGPTLRVAWSGRGLGGSAQWGAAVAVARAAGLEDPDRRGPAPWPGRGLPSSHMGTLMKLRTRSVLVRGSCQWRLRDGGHATVTVAVLNSE